MRYGVLDIRTGALIQGYDAKGPLQAAFPQDLASGISPYVGQVYAVVPSDLPELHC